MSRRDDSMGFGDSTEVVPLDEATRKKLQTPPATLGRYKLDRVLAQGGMAEVWLATVEGPQRFSKKVVVKRIRPSLVKQAQDQAGRAAQGKHVEMFVREAQLLATLKHKNIVEVIELGVEPAHVQGRLDEHYIVLELLEGLTLRDLALRVWQQKRPLPLELVVRSVADACLGLEHAHRLVDNHGQPANLVHRDISPDNLFLTNGGVTKLLDFGIAKREDWSNLTQAGELKGKVPYMAPEQLKGDRVDARTDLFSVGVVLYWLLTGRRPFDGPSDVFTMKAILDDPPRPLRQLNPQVPPVLEEVVLSCLEKEPQKRISSAAALHDALSMLLMGTSGPAPTATEVLTAALAMPPASYEVVPDVAAVPVMRWGAVTPASPAIATPSSVAVMGSKGASPIPEARDVSSTNTMQMPLAGKLGAQGNIVVGSPRAAPVKEREHSGKNRTVVGAEAEGTSETLLEIAAGNLPMSMPRTDPLGSAPSEPVEATEIRPDTGTIPKPKSWKDRVPQEVRDTVDLGLNNLDVAPPAPSPSTSPPGVPSAPMLDLAPTDELAPPTRDNVREDAGFAPPPVTSVGQSGSSGVFAAVAGVFVALLVLAVVAVAVGALPNPFKANAAVVDAGVAAAAVVVDAGAAVVIAPPPPVVVDAGVAVAALVVDAGMPEPEPVAVVDAGVVEEELPDAPDPVPHDPKKPPLKKTTTKKTQKPPVVVGQGSLVVRARPWANVIVDGAARGTTPMPVLTLSAGKHKVRLVHESVVKNLVVDVKANETTTLNVDMRH